MKLEFVSLMSPGGQAECYWDCNVFTTEDAGQVITNPECLQDCFAADHCVNLLINDYLAAGGICEESFGATIFYPGIFPTGKIKRIIYFINLTICHAVDTCSTMELIPGIITDGICSAATETALVVQNDCIYDVYKRPNLVNMAVYELIRDMCTGDITGQDPNNVVNIWDDFVNMRETRSLDISAPRYVPFEAVNTLPNGSFLRTELPFENTRHRYPWFCSLR